MVDKSFQQSGRIKKPMQPIRVFIDWTDPPKGKFVQINNSHTERRREKSSRMQMLNQQQKYA